MNSYCFRINAQDGTASLGIFYFMTNDYHCLNPILRFVPSRNYNNDMFHDKHNIFQHKVDKFVSGKEYFLNVSNIIKHYGNDYYINTIDRLRKSGDYVFEVPCRKCINCQLKHSREWTIRNKLELDSYNENALFITLTYDNDGIVYSDSGIATLNYKDIQKFFKRLRKKFDKKELRFYLAQEYGSLSLRPHYHIILYGLSLEDLKIDNESVEYYKLNEHNQEI